MFTADMMYALSLAAIAGVALLTAGMGLLTLLMRAQGNTVQQLLDQNGRQQRQLDKQDLLIEVTDRRARLSARRAKIAKRRARLADVQVAKLSADHEECRQMVAKLQHAGPAIEKNTRDIAEVKQAVEEVAAKVGNGNGGNY